MQTLNSIVFGWYPYLCLTVFLFGSLFRFDREQYTWRTGSSQLLRRRQLMWGSNLFHVGILVIFVGHFVGLLTPIWVFDMLGVSHGFKQMLAIVAGGIAPIPRSAIPRSCCCCSRNCCSDLPPSRCRWAIWMATRW
jgi:nitrate reductase gamma subunit